ncbi:MAG: helix-turn-helix transcriptional regulator [Clostridia bacterium]|nr:helix-turn-helix transcriptional regulator [Clostridia bacterium]
MDTYSAVKNRLLYLCEQKRFTINKLATESGIAPSTVKNILYGKSKNPGIVTLKMLCDGLGISLNEFFCEEIFHTLEQEIK